MKRVLINEAYLGRLKAQTERKTKKRAEKVKIKLVKQDRKRRRWVWRARSDRTTYKVTIKSLEKKGQKMLMKSDVAISCTCPAFLFWGSEYWALKGGYLDLYRPGYRYPRSKGIPPKIRDPLGKHKLCKHLLAVYEEYKDAKFP